VSRLTFSSISALRPFPGCVADGGEQPLDVAVVEAGSGVAEVDRDAGCEAGREHEYAPFSSGAGQSVAAERGDRAVPVDGRQQGAVADAGAVLDEALVKSLRCRNEPLLMSRATSASSG
jgi:hypothetical protein